MDMNKYNEWPANHKGDKNPSPKIIALGKRITDVAGHMIGGVTAEDPEYWGLAEIITEEMAEVGLTMKRRAHYTFDQLCEMNKDKVAEKGKEGFQKLLDEMSYIGLLEYDYGYHYDHNGRTAPQSERRYTLPMFVPGSAELFNMEEIPGDVKGNPRLEQHPDVASFFERMTYIPLEGITQMVPPGGAGVGMHVIPVEKAISMENEAIDIEKLSYWLSKYEGKIGVGRCSCRASRKVIGEGVADDDYGWCIGVGDFADYCRETGKGHDITKEEALEILQRAEDNGFVHQITNIDGENKIFGICNCNVNICNALRTSQLFNTPNMSRSAYVAHVDKEKCVACGRCVEYCPAGATRLGQKLCKADGTEVTYPKQLLPDKVKWGKEYYDPDYRDNNRINSHKTGTAPCKTACPAHIAVQGYLKKAAQGEYTEALALIKKQNPFPAVCGRICNRRCEDACTRGTIDQSVAIDEIKKFIAEQEINSANRFVPKVENHEGKEFTEKMAIIGAGPSGMSAAYYLREKGYPVTIFEKEQRAGGMLMNGIPSFRLEKSVIEAEIDVLRQMGIEFKFGVEVGKDVTIQQLREQGYKAFYVAIGAQGGRKTGVPGEDAEGVVTGVEFLRKANISEDAHALSGDTVVIGGGNVAIDVSRMALRSGSTKVSQYCLESRDIMPAAADEVEEAEEEGITIGCGWGPKEILTENGKVKAVVFKKCLSVFDEEHRFNPQYDENDTITVECENVILSIGQSIEWGGLLEGSKVELNRNNTAVADSVTLQTGEEDIFVGGDVYTGPRFAIDAIAAGKEASVSMHRFVHKGHSLTLSRDRRQFIELDKDNIKVETFDNAKRQVPGKKSGVSKDTFRDLRSTFTEEQIKTEAARCLGCGASVVDPNKCIGCGLCTVQCEFDAIHLNRELPECSNMWKSEDKMKAVLPYALKRKIKITFSGNKNK